MYYTPKDLEPKPEFEERIAERTKKEDKKNLMKKIKKDKDLKYSHQIKCLVDYQFL